MQSEYQSEWRLREPINNLCKHNRICAAKLHQFLPKQIWTKGDRREILAALSDLFLSGGANCVMDLCIWLGPLILEVVSRLTQSILREGHSGQRLLKKLAVVMSRGFPVSPVLQRFAVDFVQQYKHITLKDPLNDGEPPRKKARKSQISDLDWCYAMWSYMVYIPEVSDKLDMMALYDYLPHQDGLVRWYASSALSIFHGMSDAEKSSFFKKYFTTEELRLYSIRVDREMLAVQERSSKAQGVLAVESVDNSQSHTLQTVTSGDLNSDLVSVMGILLPKVTCVTGSEEQPFDPLILVASAKQHLRSLALAVSCSRPVMLQGPVGCGKTCLVQHLASLTGRNSSREMMKIQLGDQTDSKALLGTYCSTEVPGEFVWRAGVLTQAVSRGKWVLLEDVDMAPMDVLSLLVALAETGSLIVPGHGDEIKAAPGFQLFTTQRLLSSADGFHHMHGGNTALLEKLCTVINVEPLSRAELKQVIDLKFPTLAPVTDKLLDIYFMLSAGRHDLGDVSQQVDASTHGKFLSLGGRQISTRDLITWCSRSSVDFNHRESSQGLRVYLEAVDCFVSCLAKESVRLALATAIGVKLNVTEDRAKYFLTEHKPALHEGTSFLEIGRARLPRRERSFVGPSNKPAPTFSYTRSSLVLLEKVSVCVHRNEPVLLCGETGTGKTSTVQFLAHYLGHKLHVLNLNQQSDSTDLLGGFKPVDLKYVIMPLREEFETLFCESFSRAQNEKFLSHVQTLFSKKKWMDLLTLMEAPVKKALIRFEAGTEQQEKWMKVSKRIHELRLQIIQMENVLAFSFIEGTLVKALKNGDWVLLDEINLATAETLECLSGLLESVSGSVVLTERGDTEPIKRHQEFRLFACMNPATDVGKKDLPVGIRNRFTEFYIKELECPKDLATLVRDYLPGMSLSSKQVSGIVSFYLSIKCDPSDSLTDGTGHKPHFSLRTLCRALRFCSRNPCKSVPRSLFEGFCLSFLTQLDRSSHPLVENLICKHILAGSSCKAVLGQKLPKPDGQEGEFIHVAEYWIPKGKLEPSVPTNYIVTPSVRLNLKDLVRVVSAGKHAVLIQGETSVGKTSLITYLAQLTGNVCVRVNNHEHTDLQEYIGSYTADKHGKLVFKEGVLVEAMRKGHWIILDELNLAPTDVLEALNRLLDDNQELYIPETQEMVQAHPKFMLFATQNPPGLYGGRKVLSRAFRNRFIELHFDEIPPPELETILHERCSIPLSYAKKLVSVMLELQTRRRGSGIFSGKHGFMTLRDLFRWAQRYNCPDAGKGERFYDWDQHLAEHGYMVLAGRVRKPEEEVVVREVIEKHLKRTINTDALFSLLPQTSAPVADMLKSVMNQSLPGFQHIVWTYSMRRLAVLIGQAIRFKEPLLLVGDTGVGKTTVCQLYAALQGRALYTVNCHMHTESADFIGGLRPVRSHEDSESGKDNLFEWRDGPLVTAMREGAMFLMDEISLADDSVLERLNSVLEPERTILLAERGGNGETEVEKLEAAGDFQVFATMNPGGDFGKKELSPALRNRFTEIWCPQSYSRSDLIAVIEKNVNPGLHLHNTQDGTSGLGHAMMDFVEWFLSSELGKRATVSIRDILSWVNFINVFSANQGEIEHSSAVMETDASTLTFLSPDVAYIHGACLVFIDSLGTGSTTFSSEANTQIARLACLSFLCKQLSSLLGGDYDLGRCGLLLPGENKQEAVTVTDKTFCIHPFQISRESTTTASVEKFAFQAPTTCMNAQRLLRALQLPRPVLLEGSPGVGKTSLVAAVARMACKTLVRINLSEQTDVADLFGADLPVEGEEGGRFAWRDGPFLQALKAGHWIVFDELNLASQSVLEGLNACFDHRAEVYVPELGKTFHIQHEKTRIFACQNPLSQGGGRKGLPRSFLNRFTQVYVDPLSHADLLFIISAMYPDFPHDMLMAMVDFNSKIYQETMVKKLWGARGAPWEFNLRDLFRWCDLMNANQTVDCLNPGEYVGLVYKDRMRTAGDKSKVETLYTTSLGDKYPLYHSSRKLYVGQSFVQTGHSFLLRAGHGECRQKTSTSDKLLVLHSSLEPLESLMKCVEMGWLTILVGPQSSFKTSLVKLLAKLTGHSLCVLPMNSSMDTTELLGGFEQSDVWRHLGAVTFLLGEEVRKTWKQCLLESGLKERAQFHSLEQDWMKYGRLSKTTEGLSAQEVNALLLQHIQQLQNILGRLESFENENLSQAKLILSQLSVSVSNMRPGARGGAFEWVDSVLVKALKNGDWLLIDNVNFCSASVLDRLNALLEPQGVLTVNERGIVNGEIVTVVPHPEFRLFFTMDPRFGEISRAMRNRGIEIYLLGEDDGCAYSKQDVLSMLEAAGLKDAKMCEWWLAMHAAMKSQLPVGERPSIVDLLHAGAMCVQFMSRGFSVKDAVTYAAEDVYVRTKRNNTSKQSARRIMEDYLQEVPDSLCQDLGLQPLTESWVGETSTLAHIKEDAKLIMSVFESISHNSRFDSSTQKVQLQTAALIFSSLQSEQSWNLALAWLQSVSPEIVSRQKTIPVEGSEVQVKEAVVEDWLSLLTSYLKAVFEGCVYSELRGALENVFAGCPKALSLLRDQPWDLTLNPQACKKAALLYATNHGLEAGRERNLALDAVQIHISRIQMIQYCVMVAFNLKEKVETLEKSLSAGKKKSSSNNMINLVSLLLSSIMEHLPQMPSGLNDESLLHLHQSSYNLLWIFRLADVAATWQSVHKDVFTARLALHWLWLESKSGSVIMHCQSQSPKIAMVVEELKRHLGGGDTSLKLHTKFWTVFGHPKPFINQQEATVGTALAKLINVLSLSHTDSQATLRKKVGMLRDSKFRELMMQTMDLLASGELSESEKAVHVLTSNLTEKGLLPLIKSALQPVKDETQENQNVDILTTDDAGRRKKPLQFVPLWPLYGHLSLLVHMSAAEGSRKFHTRAASEALDAAAAKIACLTQVDHLKDYMVSHTPEWSCGKRLFNDKLEDLEELLSRLWHSPSCYRHQQWLAWSEVQDEMVLERDDMGPAMLHCAAVCKFAMNTLSRNSELANRADVLPFQVSLGDLQEQAQQIWLVSRHIWCHSSTLASPAYDARFSERDLLQQLFLKMMKSLQTLLSPDNQTSWGDILQHLQLTQKVTSQVVGEFQNLISSHCHHLPLKVSAMLSRCLEVVHDASCETDIRKLPPLVGHGFVYVGLLLAYFLSPRSPIDPMEKARIKLAHIDKELKDIEAELSTWNQHLEIQTGRGISETPGDYLHPRIQAQLQRQARLRSSKAKLEQCSAYRPDQLQYIQLSQAISNFMENSCPLSKMTDLVRKLNLSTQIPPAHQGDTVALTAALQEERVWQDTAERFMQRLRTNFPCFMDIVVPFNVGVLGMKLGLRLMAQNVEKSLKLSKLGLAGNVSSVVSSLCTFPSISRSSSDLLCLAKQMVGGGTNQLVSSVCELARDGGETVQHQAQGARSRLLLCGLLLLKTHSFVTRRLDRDLIMALSSILDMYSAAWSEQEERRRQKEAEELALYKYKEQTHGDERSEKEKDEADFRKAYPTFDKDFIDLTGAQKLEDIGLEVTSNERFEEARAGGLDGISQQEMVQVCTVHNEILTSLSCSDWLETRSFDISSKIDILTPCLVSYQIGSSLVRNVFDVLDPEVDSQVLGSHLVVAGSLLQHLNTRNEEQQGILRKPSEKSYNIYYDANVQEVTKCQSVIDSLRRRVRELQKEWPDHPTLVLLNQIMDRILIFSVGSPIVKFLTGLELLLQKAQDWESNAASYVSMATQLSEITALIVQWRKLELSCWSSALDREEEKCKEKASHWWFHLFQLTSDFLSQDHSSSSTDQEETSTLETLKKFMESSTMGEYSLRLQMLLAFHCQLLHMDKSPAQKQLLHIMWNIHQFYKQYLPSVESEIKRLRDPIEKQLKGFVKIARWSDMNYWALKSSAEKNHRTVHKYIKEYQAVLSQPSKSLVGDKGDDLVAQAVKQVSDFQLQEHMTALTQNLTENLDTATVEVTFIREVPASVRCDLRLILRVPSLFRKMKVHLNKHLARPQNTSMVLVFDDFTGELIQEMHELQALQVDMNAEKDKQKSEAKSIDLRKRKALAELFKYLSLVGLSYRKGVTRKTKLGFNDALELPPINLQAHPKLQIANLWSGCETYFYRCISRYAQFSAAVLSPSKELSMADVERCRGFVEHFSQLYIEQRSQLSSLLSNFFSLRSLLETLNLLHLSLPHRLPPQTLSWTWLSKTKQLTTQLIEGLLQLQLLLQSCPADDQELSLASVHPSPLPESKLVPSALWFRGDAAWTKCFYVIQEAIKKVRVKQDDVDRLLDKALLGRMDLKTLADVLETYKQLTPQFSSFCSEFSDDHSTSPCFVSSLKYLCSQVSSTYEDFCLWLSSIPAGSCVPQSHPLTSVMSSETSYSELTQSGTEQIACKDEISNFLSKTESLVETVLLSVQNVVKAGQEEVKDDKVSQDKKDDSQHEELKEAHLTRYLLDVERNIVAKLNCSQVTETLKDLISRIKCLSDGAGSSEASKDPAGSSTGAAHAVDLCVRSLLQAQPLAVVFTSLVENQLGHSIAVHRSMGKLLSVLLAVFTELSQKGFCLPPELSDEVAGEGATEFKDIEGGGLGEGEGAKDVSDQIESEDQLEEARQPGQQGEDNPKEQPDIRPEDNAIEMSDDFDGKLHDNDGADDVNDDDDNAEEEKDEDMEKQMGDIDGESSDRLDDRMWGSDDEDEDKQENKEQKEDRGEGGMDKQKEEMVAKEDNNADGEDGTENGSQKDVEESQNELMEDDDDYDDNQVNPHNKKDKEEDTENLDLPDDLNLDDGEKKDKDLDEENEENKEDVSEGDKNSEEKPGEDKEANNDGADENAEDIPTMEPEEQDEEDKTDESATLNHKAEKEDTEEDKEGEGEEGTSGHEEDKPSAELDRDKDDNHPSQDNADAADNAGDVADQADMAESLGKGVEVDREEETVRDKQDDGKENEAVGSASTEDQEGHRGQKSKQKTDASASKEQKWNQKNPGQSDSERSLGSSDKEHKQLKVTEKHARENNKEDEEERTEGRDENKSDTAMEYEHIKDAKTYSDAQTIDVATKEQMLEKQAVPNQVDEEGEELDQDDDVRMDDEEEEDMDTEDTPEAKSARFKEKQTKKDAREVSDEGQQFQDGEKVDVDGERVLTLTAERPPDSSFHTMMENLYLSSMPQELDIDAIRTELEQNVRLWSHPENTSADVSLEAAEAWQKYLTLIDPLSQELCEQLRLILEPSQATKLKGDYRTGKRLNMRKVIPYIASEFRKDKIWLRRSKPSKRQYQILIAVDDSASMADNHSKQLAFESLALVSNALTLLESGELSVCSFGEDVKLLHPFSEPFTNQSGARILQQLTCEQKQTKYGMLLDKVLMMLLGSRSHASSAGTNADTAQLLLVLSDGNGVFREGMDVVRRAVRRARSVKIFLVFIVLDNPGRKSSILDAKVPIMDQSGHIQEIKSYMEMFPFPFYIILRDINTMPQILSDALRQWFELVTSSDR